MVRIRWTTLLLALVLPLPARAGEIALAFGDAPDASDGFRIERRAQEDRRFVPIALVGPGATDFVDRGLPAGSAYCYRVRSLTGGDGAAWSPEVCAQAQEPPPLAEESAPGTVAAAAPAEPEAPPPARERRIRTSGGWLQVLDSY
jgi:hypothetical protein